MDTQETFNLFFDIFTLCLSNDRYGLFWKDGFFVDKISSTDLQKAEAKPLNTAKLNKEAATAVANKAIELYFQSDL